MKKSEIILFLVGISVILFAQGLVFNRHTPPNVFGAQNSFTIKNSTTSIVAGNFICGAASSVAYGPFNGETWFRVTNDSTSTVYLAISATSSANGAAVARTGIPLGWSTSSVNYWDLGQSNINLGGEYIQCIAAATGSVVSYQVTH